MVIIDSNRYDKVQLTHWCKLGFIKQKGLSYIVPNNSIVVLKRDIDGTVYVETTNKLIFYI